MLIGLLGCLYLVGRPDYIPFGDGLGYALAATEPTPDLSTNATSHLAYQVLLWAVVNFLPLKVEIALSVFSLGFALFTLWQLDLLLKAIGRNYATRSIITLALGLSFIFWRHAEIPEMYTSYWFCLVVSLRMTYQFLKKVSVAGAIVLGLFSGFTLMVHIAHLLYMLPLGLVLLFSGWRANLKPLIILVFITLITSSPLLILPLAAGDPRDYALKRVLYDALPDVVGVSNGILLSYTFGLVTCCAYALYNFGLFAILSMMTLIQFARKSVSSPVCWSNFLLLQLVLALLYFSRFSNLQVAPFYIPIYIVCLIILSGSIEQAGYKWRVSLLASTITLPLMYYAAFCIASHAEVAKINSFAESKQYKGGLAYYLLPWQQSGLDAISIVDSIQQLPPGVEKTRLMEDIGYNYPQGLELIERRKHDQRLAP